MKIKENIKLAPYTTYKIGGPARYFVRCKTEQDVIKALRWAKEKEIKYFILGGGSNVLVADRGYQGLVIFMGNDEYKLNGEILNAGAGVLMHTIVEETVNRGLGGLEWAGGLPGQLGGAVRGNANCFGGQMEDVVKSLRVLMPDGKIKIFNKKECQFKAKASIFKENPELIILSAVLNLKKVSKDKLQEKVKYCINWRKKNQPMEHGTCGSAFTRKLISDLPKDFFQKHPHAKVAIKGNQKDRELATAYLIDDLGLKGAEVGGAMVSHKHANFIVNVENAKAEHIIMLSNIVKSRVLNKYEILLEEEVCYLS